MIEKLNTPYLLQQIPDRPSQLYIRGNFPDENKYKFLTVIGSRKFTTYGKQVCEKIIRDLAGYPIVVVSGLALGIDSIAHQAALDNNLKTIAVPGSGISEQVLYPASNRGLAQKILQSGGALVSEYEPDFRATNWSFPKRNRIMAGMSHAVLVIEAENKSGTRITARLATDYNREVFSVPGSIFSPSSTGCNELIREGAFPITSGQDIIEFFNLDHTPQQPSLLIDLSEHEQLIMQTLVEPLSRNEITEQTKLSIVEVNIALSNLEISGIIKEDSGKIYKI